MGELAPKTDREVIKHSAAIQIQNNITLLQRRAWNILLHHAYPSLLEREIHSISVKYLCEVLDFNSHNQEYIKDALRAMTSCTLQWNVLQKDNSHDWGVAALLADARIKDGCCTYSYGAQFRHLLHNPKMYARISLSLQNKFESKYGQALWELCVDYLGQGREYGETPFILIEQIRKLMGLGEGQYRLYRDLNKYVFKPAVAEINKISDLRVTVDHQRKGRKVTALKFKIRRVVMLPDANGRQSSLFPDLEDMPMAVKLLKDAGLANGDAWEFWQKGFEFVDPAVRPSVGDENPDEALMRYVREKIHLLDQRRKSGKVANPSGFLITALRKNYSNAQFETEEKTQKRAEKVKRLRRLLQDKERLTQEQDTALHGLTGKIIDAFPEQLEKAVKALLEEKSAGFAYAYRQDKTPMENYREHRGIAVTIGTWLESRFAEQYAEARQPYREQLAEIETQVSALDAEGINVKLLR